MSDLNLAGVFQSHPGAYVGPLVLSATTQGFLTGLALNFAYRSWRDEFVATHHVTHGIMLLVVCLVLTQTILSYWSLYHRLIGSFGDWTVFDFRDPASIPHTALGFTTAFLAKILLIFRCRELTSVKHRWKIMTVQSASFIFFTAASIASFVQLSKHEDPMHEYDVGYLLVLTSMFLSDLTISAILFFLVLRTRPQIFASSITTSIYRLSFVLWESFLPPTVSMLIAIIMYVCMVKRSHWPDVPIQSMGQLYAIALFTSITGRRLSPEVPDTSVSSKTRGIHWNRAPLEHPNDSSAPDFELQSFQLPIPLSLNAEHVALSSPHSPANTVRKAPPMTTVMVREREHTQVAKGDGETGTTDGEGDADVDAETDGERSIKAHAISASSDDTRTPRFEGPRRQRLMFAPDTRAMRGMGALEVGLGGEEAHAGRSWSAGVSFGSRLRFWNRNRERDGPLTPS